MRQRLRNILEEFRTPLQSVGVVFLFLMSFIIVLWGLMAAVRIVMG